MTDFSNALPPRCPHCGDVLVDDGDWYCMGLYGHAPAPTKRERKGYAQASGQAPRPKDSVRIQAGYPLQRGAMALTPPVVASTPDRAEVGVPRDLAGFLVDDAAMRRHARKWLGSNGR